MKKYLTIACCVICFAAKGQSRIVKDSLMFTLSVPKLDTIFNGLGIPPSIVGVAYAVDVHRLIYKTMNYDSSATIASGLVMIPRGVDYCKLPIISYQHGTIIDRRQVPSRWVGSERYISLAIASNGLISIMPDYLGMGDGIGLHPYQNARTEAFSVIDMIRATKELCDSVRVGYSDQLFLFGYSQGGHATMAAHKMIQEKLSNEMKVTASAPMSGAYDMSGVQTNLLLEEKPYSDPYYLPYLIFGNNPIYKLFTNPSDVLKAPYDVDLPPLMNGLTSSNTINSKMNDTVKRIFRDNVLDSFVTNQNYFFRNFLKDNDVYSWVPTSPVRMYFCNLDEKVPFQNTYVAYNYFKQNGALNIDTVNSGNYLHTDCAQPSFLNAKFWIDGFRTKPLTVSVSTQPSIANDSTGSATATALEGLVPYTYKWSNGRTSSTISNIKPNADYQCTVTDKNGCEKTVTVRANVLSISSISKVASFSMYPNPANDKLNIELGEINGEQELKIIDALGKIIIHQTIADKSIQVNVELLSGGVYYVSINNQFAKFLKQ